MSDFENIIFPLLSTNKELFHFINSKAIDGCWIYSEEQKSSLILDNKMKANLGFSESKLSINRILGREGQKIAALTKQPDSEDINNYAKTIRVVDQNGGSILQKLNLFKTQDLQGRIFILGGHENIYKSQVIKDKSDRYVIEGTDLGTWEWNVQTGETVFNERWADIIGYKLEEIEPVSIDTWMKYAHPDDLEESNKLLEEHFNGNTEFYEFESRMRHKDGHWIWVLDKGKVFSWTEDGKPEWMVGSHQEITKQKIQQKESEKYKHLLERSTRVATIGVWEVDLVQNKIFWGSVTKKIHEVSDNYEPELERAIAFFPEGKNRDKIIKHFNNAIEKAIPYDIELQILTANNKLKWVRAIGLPEHENGQCIRVYGLFQDIDIIKKTQQQNNELIESTQEQNKRLMNFAHIVSHNLRSHSNNFSMLSGLLQTNLTDERREKVYEMLVSASDKLKDTILHLDQVVDINLKLADNFTNVSLNKSLKSSVASLAAVADDSELEINLNLDREYTIYGVAAYLESLTLNFISNAIKYSDPAKEKHYLNISAERVLDEVLVHFEDNGLGINLEKHGDKLFGMYKTFHNTKDSKGIGLFITKNQVEAMGGRIKVDSEVGKGTTFTVYLKAKSD